MILRVLAGFVFAVMLSATAPALAQGTGAQESGNGSAPAFQGFIPPSSASVSYGTARPDGVDTHPALQLTPDKSELVRLDRDAGSVIVGNPDHLGVLMDNRRLLILVPREPGATYLTVLDSAGDVVMQRHVIVVSPKENYIRIRRSCASGDRGCEPTSVYYCPGMCHPVGLVTARDSGNVPAVPASGGMIDSGDSDIDNSGDDSAVESALPGEADEE